MDILSKFALWEVHPGAWASIHTPILLLLFQSGKMNFFFFLEAILHQRDTAIQWSCIPPICPLKVIFWCSEEKGRAPGRTSLHGEDSAVGHIQLAASGSVSTAYKYWKNIFSFSSAASPQVRFWKSAISATSPPVGVWSSETFLELKLAQKPWGWIAFY